ncbi:hypothetical protein V5O48_003076 [Marasmius crinis-equi]|uniref:Protein kinase domain-containing protein n=1 Tax=Marasmius crinis-equi TaxID=585013 RepID=A0ABR3FTW9_9AGAR
MFDDEQRYTQVLETRGDDAQKWLDALQVLLERPDIATQLRSSTLKMMLRLSKHSELCPKCLMIEGVKKHGDFPVGGGGFADVWKGEIKEQMVCLKVVRVYKNSDVKDLIKGFMKEAIVWQQLTHANVLPFVGMYYLDEARKQLCLVSPWMEKGDLPHYLEETPREHVDHQSLAFDVAAGLSYLHSRKIVHGDLKGVNVLMTPDERACIGDFGLSCVADSCAIRLVTSSIRQSGTTRWLSPELLELSGRTTKSSDIYAYACIFTGKVPFHGSRDCAVISAVVKKQRPLRPIDELELTDEMWEVMVDCWKHDQSQRPTAADVLERIGQLKSLRTGEPVELRPARDWDYPELMQIRQNVRYPPINPKELLSILSNAPLPGVITGISTPDESALHQNGRTTYPLVSFRGARNQQQNAPSQPLRSPRIRPPNTLEDGASTGTSSWSLPDPWTPTTPATRMKTDVRKLFRVPSSTAGSQAPSNTPSPAVRPKSLPPQQHPIPPRGSSRIPPHPSVPPNGSRQLQISEWSVLTRYTPQGPGPSSWESSPRRSLDPSSSSWGSLGPSSSSSWGDPDPSPWGAPWGDPDSSSWGYPMLKKDKDEKEVIHKQKQELKEKEKKEEEEHIRKGKEKQKQKEEVCTKLSNGPQPLPSALSTARMIDDLGRVTYPEGVMSPKVELNVNAQSGKFRYDRDFLLQFMSICKEKPDMLPPLDAIGLKPAGNSSFGLSRGGSGHRRINPSATPSYQPSLRLGFGRSEPESSFGGRGAKLTSEERFRLVNDPVKWRGRRIRVALEATWTIDGQGAIGDKRPDANKQPHGGLAFGHGANAGPPFEPVALLHVIENC